MSVVQLHIKMGQIHLFFFLSIGAFGPSSLLASTALEALTEQQIELQALGRTGQFVQVLTHSIGRKCYCVWCSFLSSTFAAAPELASFCF
jgi:hypothetical protein